MKSTLLLLLSFLITTSHIDAQALRVSQNMRFLEREDGKPFFWLGDTAWELIHRLNKEEINIYFKNRHDKGFNVIQTVILAEQDGLNTPNANGDKPLIDNDPARPNESYFKYVDEIVDMAEKNNLYLGLLPTWGDKVFRQEWGVGPEIFNPENARIYGEFLGRRYRDEPNIIWILGGDRVGEGYEQIWDSMAEGILNQDKNHLISYHPRGGLSSALWFHNRSWLDFNMIQSGHSDNAFNYKMIKVDYEKEPVKPVLDSEPCYELIPINFNPEEGRIYEYEVRRAAYWSVFSGSFGHTYGSNPIWQMYDEGRHPVIHPVNYWHEVLDLPGAFQMGFLKKLLLSRDFFSRVPDQSLIAGEIEATRKHISATRGKDYALIYCPLNHKVEVNMSKISGENVRAWWFNPRNGTSTEIGVFKNSGISTFVLPLDGPDWILVLDDINANYQAPGLPLN